MKSRSKVFSQAAGSSRSFLDLGNQGVGSFRFKRGMMLLMMVKVLIEVEIDRPVRKDERWKRWWYWLKVWEIFGSKDFALAKICSVEKIWK